MTTTIYNIISNAIARIWTIGIGIVLVPVYINLIGIESYGLIGFYGTLMGSLAILDLGLSSTLSREMARVNATGKPISETRDLVFSLELIYWAMGILLGAIVYFLSPYIAEYWLKPSKIERGEVDFAIKLIGGIIAFQWPQSIYSGGLMGLQKQVSLNFSNVILSTLKSAGVILVLNWFSPSIEVFFIWQIIVSFITVCAQRFLLWKYIPKSKIKAKFNKIELKKIWRFAAGMTGISLASFCIMQIDKIMLSKLLSLSDYGYYILAWTIGTSVLFISSILGNVLLPKMTEIVAREDSKEIILSFHRYNRLVCSVIVPMGVFLIFFSKDIIGMWTQNNATTDHIWLAVAILTAGSICNIFMHIPYFLMLAYGDTQYTIYQNVITSIIILPLLFLLTNLWGIIGASLVWLIVNLGYNIISLPLLHRKFSILKNQFKTTLIKDIGIVFIVSIFILGLGRIVYSSDWSFELKFLYFFVLLTLVYLSIIQSNIEYKKWIYMAYNKFNIKSK